MLKNRALITAFVFVLLSITAMSVTASDAEYLDSTFFVNGFQNPEWIYDGIRETYGTAFGTGSITVKRSDGIHSIYVVHDSPPTEWYITDPSDGKTVPCGTDGFLHEYIDVYEMFDHAPSTLVLTFHKSASVCDVYAFSKGELPDFVQIWEKPLTKADLMLVSAHYDDVDLYFAGLLPYYAGERGLDVQVVYSVQNHNLNGEIDHMSGHEQLDSLWAVGIRNYPVISEFPDLYTENPVSELALEEAKNAYQLYGISYDSFVKYFTDNIRRFKPLVVVSHDLDGEYGHGTHVMTAEALTDAVKLAADLSHDLDSASKYGVWCVSKLYFHLYGENKTVLDLDIPLENFDGKTAFEMSQYALGLRKELQDSDSYKWLCGTKEEPITKASQIVEYSPCEYGLYFTSIEADTVGTDLFENVKPYAERDTSGEYISVLDSMEAPATLHPYSSEVSDVTESADTAEDTDNIESQASTKVIISVIIIISVMICSVIGIFIFSSSKITWKNRKRIRNQTNR